MKKCPYCAEEIQDEAIVCRYCGRDLPQDKTEGKKRKRPKKAKRPIWKEAAIIVGVWGALYGCALFSGYYGEPSVDQVISLPISMIIWWFIFMGLVALKRKLLG